MRLFLLLVGCFCLAQEPAKNVEKELSPLQKVGTWKQQKMPIGGSYSAQGPGPATGGQVEGITGMHVTGALEAMALHPTDPDQIWVGSVNGGIHYSSNATSGSPSWTPQGDAFGSMSISALELDPTDTTDPRTLVAGIGGRSSFSGVQGTNIGVLRTTDSGSTWSVLSGMADREISGLAARGATIVASVNTGSPFSYGNIGIWRSTDTGGTWSQISGAGGSGLPDGITFDLAADPTDSTRLYTVVTTGLMASDNGIYRSTNTGATWTKISSAALDTALTGSVSRAEIAVGTAGTGGGTTENIFVAVCTGGALSSLWYTADTGSTWSSIGTLPNAAAGGIHPGGQASIHLSLAAHPTDHDVCFVGGDRQDCPCWPNSLGATDYSGNLARVDFGTGTSAHITHSNTGSGSAPHADSREMKFDANGDLIETDDGGIYKHPDPDLTSGDWVSLNGDLQVNEQHDMAYDEISSILFSGNQDTGTTAQTSTGSATWTSYSTGDGGDVDVGLNDSIMGRSMRYRSFQTFSLPSRREYDSSNTFLGSTSLGLATTGCTDTTAIATSLFVVPVAVNRGDPTRILIGGSNGLYESMDRGGIACRISLDIVNNGAREPLAYGTSGNNDVIYYGTGDDVYIRTAAPPAAPAASAAYAAMAGTTGDDVLDIAIDPDDATHAFVIDSDQVFRTTDSGTTWTDVTDNLFVSFTPGNLRCIEYMNGTAGKDGIAVGADSGVYAALEIAGTPFTTWDTLGTSLPNCLVFELHFSNTDDTLAAGTMGRGSWTLSPIIANLPIELQTIEIE